MVSLNTNLRYQEAYENIFLTGIITPVIITPVFWGLLGTTVEISLEV